MKTVPCFPTRAPVMQALPSAHRRLTWHTHCSFTDPEMGIFCLTRETAFTPDVQKGTLAFAGSVFEDKQKHPDTSWTQTHGGLLACAHPLPAECSRLSLSAHLLLITYSSNLMRIKISCTFHKGLKKKQEEIAK